MTSIALYSPQQAHAALSALWAQIKPSLLDGKRLTVKVTPVSKSREQEEKYHAMIGEIAAQAKHLGSTWDAEGWKRLLLDDFAKETNRPRGRLIPSLSGDGVVEVGLLSRNFSVQDGADFIEWLYAWGTEHGVTFREQ
jgi:hypothetical protein